MSRVEEYRALLRQLDTDHWHAFLTERSGLPGPRGNIELGQAAAEEADPSTIDALIATNDEFLVFCGVIGLGRILAEGGHNDLGSVRERLRAHAGDERWRVREAVAMAVQRLGDEDPLRMVELVNDWVGDPNALVQRAAIAGICEPRLLRTPTVAQAAIETVDRVTASLAARAPGGRRDPSVRSLRQALGYCWSVAVAADPERGLPRFLALSASSDPDVRWVVRENGRKARLAKLLGATSQGC
ncbi:MAG: HEAT repeat domain-containing protein [Candidatus Phosphoribacter sp.]